MADSWHSLVSYRYTEIDHWMDSSFLCPADICVTVFLCCVVCMEFAGCHHQMVIRSSTSPFRRSHVLQGPSALVKVFMWEDASSCDKASYGT